MKRGAGIFFTDGKSVLLLKRSKSSRHGGKWCIPGGKTKGTESRLQTAQRESEEECGKVEGDNKGSLKHNTGDFEWTTFFFKVTEKFVCKLNEEHTDWRWVKVDELHTYDLIPPFKDRLQVYRSKVSELV